VDVGKEVEEKDDERGCSTAEAENRELAHDTPGGGGGGESKCHQTV